MSGATLLGFPVPEELPPWRTPPRADFHYRVMYQTKHFIPHLVSPKLKTYSLYRIIANDHGGKVQRFYCVIKIITSHLELRIYSVYRQNVRQNIVFSLNFVTHLNEIMENNNKFIFRSIDLLYILVMRGPL